MYFTSKEISQTETISLEPRTFPDVSSEILPVTSTGIVEIEYETQKSFRNESTTTETYRTESAKTSTTVNDAFSSEASSTTGHVPSTR